MGVRIMSYKLKKVCDTLCGGLWFCHRVLTIANLGAKNYATCKIHGSLVGGCGFKSAIDWRQKSLYIYLYIVLPM